MDVEENRKEPPKRPQRTPQSRTMGPKKPGPKTTLKPHGVPLPRIPKALKGSQVPKGSKPTPVKPNQKEIKE